MALSSPRIAFGIHSIAPYSRTDGTPYGILKVLGGGTLNLSSPLEELFGGSQKFAWATESKASTAEFSCTVKALPDFLFTLFLGATVTTTAASTTSGTIGALANVKGTTAFSATIGIATITLTTAADMKTGKYLIVAASATTVDVYILSDVEFSRGTALTYTGDALKVAAALTVTSGGTTAITGTGLTITGGSGTIGMTSGDSFTFQVDKPHAGLSQIVIGAAGATYPEHGEFVVAAKRATGEIFEMDLYKCVGSGFPIGLTEQAFSTSDIKISLLYDSAKDGICKILPQAQ